MTFVVIQKTKPSERLVCLRLWSEAVIEMFTMLLISNIVWFTYHMFMLQRRLQDDTGVLLNAGIDDIDCNGVTHLYSSTDPEAYRLAEAVARRCLVVATKVKEIDNMSDTISNVDQLIILYGFDKHRLDERWYEEARAAMHRLAPKRLNEKVIFFLKGLLVRMPISSVCGVGVAPRRGLSSSDDGVSVIQVTRLRYDSNEHPLEDYYDYVTEEEPGYYLCQSLY